VVGCATAAGLEVVSLFVFVGAPPAEAEAADDFLVADAAGLEAEGFLAKKENKFF